VDLAACTSLLSNGASCSSDSACLSGNCEGGTCTAAPECGDGTCSPGESCPTDCSTTSCTDSDDDGYYGNAGTSSCPGFTKDCVDSDASINPGATENCDDNIDNNCAGGTNEGCCGNGACNSYETDTSCSTDCKGDLQVLSISAPSTVDQGQTVQVQATIKNQGTYKHTLYAEAGIAPDYWQQYGYFMQGYDAQLAVDAQKCCTGNEFYSAKTITLNPGESQIVTFNVKSPTVSTTDSCWTVANRKSAWDSSHTLVLGLYKECAGGYWSKKTQDIKVKDKPCGKQADCNTATEYCKISGSTGTCQPKLCTNTCTTDGQYACQGDTKVLKCADHNSDGCLEYAETATCLAPNKCVQGLSQCQPATKTSVKVEYSEQSTVLKQEGDKLRLRLKYNGQEPVKMQYAAAAFQLDTSTCSSSFTITSDRDCMFTVKNGASGSYYIGIEGNVKQVLITKPKAIMITNKQKLEQRFGNDKSGVEDLLMQAYLYAGTEQVAIYNLEDYSVSTHPWTNFGQYTSTPYYPFWTGNSYENSAAEFIKSKCGQGCTDTIILGDDFIVPQFRRKLPIDNGKDSVVVQTDTGYSKKTNVEFKDLDKTFVGKTVLFVVPDAVNQKFSADIIDLKNTIESKGSTVQIKNDTELGCDSFYQFYGKTLVLFGNEQTNQIISCLSYFGIQDSSIIAERSSWSPDQFSIVVNPSPNADTIWTLNKIIAEGAKESWTFGDAVVACLWTGKFEGSSHPIVSEMTCNMIPLVELAPDIRDSGKCLLKEPEGYIGKFMCFVTHFATGYDITTWGGAILTAGATGIGGEVLDISIAQVKITLKVILVELGEKVVKDAWQTITAAPKLIKWLAEFPTHLKATIKILGHSPEIAEETFNYIKQTIKSKWTDEAMEGAPHLIKFSKKVPFEYRHLPDALQPHVAEFFFNNKFGDVYEKSVTSMKISSSGVSKVSFTDKTIAGSWAQFNSDLKVLTLETLPNNDFISNYFFKHPDAQIRAKFYQLFEQNGFKTEGLDSLLKSELYTTHPEEVAKIAGAFKGHILQNSVPHELAHARFHEVRNVGKSDALYSSTYEFREYVADATAVKSMDSASTSFFKQSHDLNGIVSLARSGTQVNEEGLKMLRRLIQSSIDSKSVSGPALDRALAKIVGTSQQALDDYDALLLDELTKHFNDATNAQKTMDIIKQTTELYIQKGDELVTVLKQEGATAQQYEKVDVILNHIDQQLDVKNFDAFGGI